MSASDPSGGGGSGKPQEVVPETQSESGGASLTGRARTIFEGVRAAVGDALRLGTATVDFVEFQKTKLDDAREVATDGLDTEHANTARVLISKGDDEAPEPYDITFQVWNSRRAKWMTHSQFTGETARSWSFNETTTRFRVKLKNASGGSEPFYIYTESLRE